MIPDGEKVKLSSNGQLIARSPPSIWENQHRGGTSVQGVDQDNRGNIGENQCQEQHQGQGGAQGRGQGDDQTTAYARCGKHNSQDTSINDTSGILLPELN